MKNMRNIVITAAARVFFVLRKTVEKKTAVIANVPRCNVAVRNMAPNRSQCNPSSMNMLDDAIPAATNASISPMRQAVKTYRKITLPVRYFSRETGLESTRSMVLFSTS